MMTYISRFLKTKYKKPEFVMEDRLLITAYFDFEDETKLIFSFVPSSLVF